VRRAATVATLIAQRNGRIAGGRQCAWEPLSMVTARLLTARAFAFAGGSFARVTAGLASDRNMALHLHTHTTHIASWFISTLLHTHKAYGGENVIYQWRIEIMAYQRRTAAIISIMKMNINQWRNHRK